MNAVWGGYDRVRLAQLVEALHDKPEGRGLGS